MSADEPEKRANPIKKWSRHVRHRPSGVLSPISGLVAHATRSWLRESFTQAYEIVHTSGQAYHPAL
jgi:hypothetical protein